MIEGVENEVDEIKEDIDEQSAQLRTLEQEVQTLEETGTFTGTFKYIVLQLTNLFKYRKFCNAISFSTVVVHRFY